MLKLFSMDLQKNFETIDLGIKCGIIRDEFNQLRVYDAKLTEIELHDNKSYFIGTTAEKIKLSNISEKKTKPVIMNTIIILQDINNEYNVTKIEKEKTYVVEELE